MQLMIAPEIAAAYPELRIGILVGQGAVNDSRANTRILGEIKRDASEYARSLGYNPGNLSDHPYMACWRETYRSFGAKPKKHRPTAEALLRRVLQGEEIPSISPIVDTYLAVEARWWLPVGGYDLRRVHGDIMLRFSRGGEAFVGIGAEGPDETENGEIVYADEAMVLTRRWNYKDADATKITAESSDVALFVEAPGGEIPTDVLEECVAEMAENLERVCGGTWKTTTCTMANQRTALLP